MFMNLAVSNFVVRLEGSSPVSFWLLALETGGLHWSGPRSSSQNLHRLILLRDFEDRCYPPSHTLCGVHASMILHLVLTWPSI